MNEQNDNFTTPEDAIIREKLGEIYAAPSDPAYWAALQLRILERVADSDPRLWWMFMGRWARAGIAAAAVALVAASIVSVAINRSDPLVAYESVLDDRTPITTLDRVSRTAGISDGEAALRYVFAY